jgi:tRNA dimethylallyltransferase
MESSSDSSPLVVIVGETASGKSALAMVLAEKFNGEIIAADSWTVYKGFDIGTAKPSLIEQAKIPHHLLDVADPKKGFNAALFKRLAIQAIKDISARRKLPILVGGTGLYIDSILYDYQFLPPSTDKRREQLNSLHLSSLLAMAEDLGLETQTIDARNKRRVIRLIESNGQQPTKRSLRKNTLIVGLQISPQALENKIKQRVEVMVSMGLIEEVRRLGKKYGWDIEPFRAPDYRAFMEYVAGGVTLEQAKDRFVRNDLQLAKKQRTWFKRNKSIHWIENQRQAVDLVTTFLNK